MSVTIGNATYNWSYQYNGLNQLVSMTDSCGHTTRYDYKNLGRPDEQFIIPVGRITNQPQGKNWGQGYIG